MSELPVVPFTEDHDTAGFFAAAGRGELALCVCANCERVLHMPMPWCRHCKSGETRWDSVRPTGKIYSHTLVTHQVHPGFPVPHTLLLIELDDAPQVRLVGRLDGAPDVAIGDAVRATFRSVDERAGLPQWHLVQ